MSDKLKKMQKTGVVDTVTIMVKRDTLRPSPWNPEIRTQLEYLKDLRESMATDGFWDFCPLLVDKSGVIIDGNRRWVVAKLLGIDDVPVTIVDDDADRIWAMYNGTRMNLTGPQALQAFASGLKTRPPKFAALIARLEAVIGEEGAKQLGQRGVSPGVINVARRVGRYCLLEDDKEFMRLTVFWLVNHSHMTTLVIRAIREGVDANILERAIRGNRPLTPNYG